MHSWSQYARILFMARRYDVAAAALHRVGVPGDGLRPAHLCLLVGVELMRGRAEEAARLCAPAATLDTKELPAIACHRLG